MAQNQKSGNSNSSNARDTTQQNDYAKIGPTSIEGVEASDLPDKGRGDVSMNMGKEAGRKLPQQTGEWETGDTGLKGDPDVADADEHGHQNLS